MSYCSIVNVEAAIVREEKWLLIKRSLKESHAGGTLSLVGGKVEVEGFSSNVLEEAIKREVMEEVGIVIHDPVYYCQSTSFVSDDGIPVVDIVFLCTSHSGEPTAKSADEVDGVFWMTADEILAHPLAPKWTKESIKRARQVHELLRFMR